MCHWIGVLDLKKDDGEVVDEEFEVDGVEGSVVECKYLNLERGGNRTGNGDADFWDR